MISSENEHRYQKVELKRLISGLLASVDAKPIISLSLAFVMDYKVVLTLQQLWLFSGLQAKIDAGSS